MDPLLARRISGVCWRRTRALNRTEELEVGRMAEKVKDLVCGMEINKADAAATYEYEGQTYYFCEPVCQWTFEEDPERYLEKSEGPFLRAVGVGGTLRSNE